MISILGDYNYTFPKPIPLKLKLKDMLEEKVDEKYFLSDKMITANNEKWTGNNDKSIINKTLASTINTNEGSRRCDSSNYISYDLEENCNLKKELCNNLIKNNLVKENDVIKHSYTKSRFNDWDKRNIEKNNISPTLDTRCDCLGIVVPEKTKKGYTIAKEGDGVYLNRPHQKRGVVQKNKIQTLKTSCDDLGVVVGTYQYSKSDNFMKGKSRYNFAKEVSDTIQTTQKEGVVFLENKLINNPLKGKTKYGWHFEQNVYDDESCCRTLKASEGSGNKPKVIFNLRIRKLTPKECFRLMGVKDEDFENVRKNQSDSSLYHLAGDSLVTTVMMAIFGELFEIDWQDKINYEKCK